MLKIDMQIIVFPKLFYNFTPQKFRGMENNESTVKSRLLEYLKYKRISQIEFTKSIDVSSTYIGAMRKGIPAGKLKRISERYPDLNRDWLLYGEGEMLLDPEEEANRTHRERGYETLLLPVAALFAGNLQAWSEGVSHNQCQRIVSPVFGADFAIPVKGDSMEPKFHDGSVILIKKINEKAFIPWGNAMVIDTENGVYIKNIYPSEKNGQDNSDEFLIAKSLNPNYPPFKIPTSSIYGIYRVMGSMDIYSTN